MAKGSNHYLLKLNRLLVGVSLPLLIVFIITGYGIINPKLVNYLTAGILTLSSSLYLHRTLDLPLLGLLMIHVLIEAKFTLTRWGIKNGRLLNVLLIILGILSMAIILLMRTTAY